VQLLDIRSVFSAVAMALLTACGGDTSADRPAADSGTAAPAAVNAPRADCEAEGCNRPRIIDGLAEQYRANVVAEQAAAAEPMLTGASEPAAAVPAQESGRAGM
jgi:hypothetical protein